MPELVRSWHWFVFAVFGSLVRFLAGYGSAGHELATLVATTKTTEYATGGTWTHLNRHQVASIAFHLVRFDLQPKAQLLTRLTLYGSGRPYPQ